MKKGINKPKVVACIQARMGSKRLKNKALLEISGKSITEIIFDRLKASKEIDDIVLSTSSLKENDVLVKHAKDIGLKYYQGSETDLVLRHLGAAKQFKADAIVRITGDCPVIDPKLIDKMIKVFRKSPEKFDLITNIFPPTFPDGLDAEILPVSTLKKMDYEIKNPLHREWLTCYLMENPKQFRIYNVKNTRYPFTKNLRLTIDYPEDVLLVKKIFKTLGKKDRIFTFAQIVEFSKKNPDIMRINLNRIDNVITQGIRSSAYFNIKNN
ncbi:cytidylyltransferase domain-containing protein [Patescibacteria group bacterium]